MHRLTFPRRRWSYALPPLIALFAFGCDSNAVSGPATADILPLPAHLVLDAPGTSPGSPTGTISLTLTRSGLRVDPPGAGRSAAPTFRLARVNDRSTAAGGAGANPRVEELQPGDETYVCPIEPGTYAIIDSTGKVVGVLIVYPDCRTVIYPLS